MELLLNSNFDFLSKKLWFMGASVILIVAGLLSIFFWHGIPLGVDFSGGTLVYVKFTHAPNPDAIRAAMEKVGLRNARIQNYGPAANNEVLIALEMKETSEAALDQGKIQIIRALETNRPEGKQDLNNVGSVSLRDYLLEKDPLRAGTDAEKRYQAIADTIVSLRDKAHGGVLSSIDQLSGQVPPEVISALKADFFTSDFGVRNVEIVGPQVGAQLRKQALLATLYSLAGMLVYLWFRFEFIYGAAAVVAVFHDVLITLGAFSLTNKEISLTVIAALLTLIGYSMNDTIVIFDRIRENLKIMRRERLTDLVNKSINQTLSRTFLTSGLTFLTVLSLYLFGGEVLHGFSFALVIGILVGTYSTLFVAAPILVWYQEWRGARGGGRQTPVAAEPARREKVRAKA